MTFSVHQEERITIQNILSIIAEVKSSQTKTPLCDPLLFKGEGVRFSQVICKLHCGTCTKCKLIPALSNTAVVFKSEKDGNSSYEILHECQANRIRSLSATMFLLPPEVLPCVWVSHLE